MVSVAMAVMATGGAGLRAREGSAKKLASPTGIGDPAEMG